MESKPLLILASASPRRVLLLRELYPDFEILPAEIEELGGDSCLCPEELALENARRKARSIAALRPAEIVLGADTVVALGNQVFGKPSDFERAESMLGCLNGREHRVITAVCLTQQSSSQEESFLETSRVKLRDLTRQQRRLYLHRIQPLDKAGSYAAQDDRGEIIESLEGSRSNVVGLPLESLRIHLTRFLERLSGQSPMPTLETFGAQG